MKKLLVCAALIVSLVLISGCGGEKLSKEQALTSELFSRLYNASAEELTGFAADEMNERVEAVEERFSAYFTPEAYNRFTANRDSELLFLIADTGGESRIDSFSMYGVKEGTLRAESTVILTIGGKEYASPVKAELEFTEEDGRVKISFLFFLNLPYFPFFSVPTQNVSAG